MGVPTRFTVGPTSGTHTASPTANFGTAYMAAGGGGGGGGTSVNGPGRPGWWKEVLVCMHFLFHNLFLSLFL
jgi:hypothetical protein